MKCQHITFFFIYIPIEILKYSRFSAKRKLPCSTKVDSDEWDDEQPQLLSPSRKKVKKEQHCRIQTSQTLEEYNDMICELQKEFSKKPSARSQQHITSLLKVSAIYGPLYRRTGNYKYRRYYMMVTFLLQGDISQAP